MQSVTCTPLRSYLRLRRRLRLQQSCDRQRSEDPGSGSRQEASRRRVHVDRQPTARIKAAAGIRWARRAVVRTPETQRRRDRASWSAGAFFAS